MSIPSQLTLKDSHSASQTRGAMFFCSKYMRDHISPGYNLMFPQFAFANKFIKIAATITFLYIGIFDFKAPQNHCLG